jgi:hypothetical protein
VRLPNHRNSASSFPYPHLVEIGSDPIGLIAVSAFPVALVNDFFSQLSIMRSRLLPWPGMFGLGALLVELTDLFLFQPGRPLLQDTGGARRVCGLNLYQFLVAKSQFGINVTVLDAGDVLADVLINAGSLFTYATSRTNG